MFNIHIARRQEAAKAAAAEAAERRGIAEGMMSPQRRDRMCVSLYGKSSAQMAQAREERVGDWLTTTVDNGLPESCLPTADDGSGYHSFRDRAEEQELGHPYVSATRFVPRTQFTGGGKREGPLFGAPPRGVKPHVLYSSSSCDAMPRIKQMPFNSKTRNPLERTRSKAQELGKWRKEGASRATVI